MSNWRQAAEAALEALEGKRYTACGWRSDCDKAITALKAALAEPPDSTKPVAERNFCSRCGKRTNDIHTCTPPLADGDNLSPTGCDHCRHVLYAATKCKNCGRVTE